MASAKQQHPLAPEVCERLLATVLDAEVDRLDGIYRRTYDALKEVVRLGENLRFLQDAQVKELNAKVDAGCDVLVDAIVPDTSSVFVNTALGFYVQMPLDEAVLFAEKKEAYYHQELAFLREKYCEMRARITMIEEAQKTLAEMD